MLGSNTVQFGYLFVAPSYGQKREVQLLDIQQSLPLHVHVQMSLCLCLTAEI